MKTTKVAVALIAATALVSACSSSGGGKTPAKGASSAPAATGSSSAAASTAAGGNTGSSLEVFSWWTTGSENAALQALISNFTASSGAKVVNGAVSNINNAQAVLKSRLASGNAPDTWQALLGAGVYSYADAGEVADNTAIYDANKFQSVMPKDMIAALSRNGKIYGVPVDAERENELWFNKSLLAKAGVATPTENYSVDAWISDLGKLKAAGVTAPLCMPYQTAPVTSSLFENILVGEVGVQGMKDLASGAMKWTDAKVKKAASDYGKVIAFADPEAASLSWDQAAKKLATGKCAFFDTGDWSYGEYIKDGAKDGVDFGYVPSPGDNGIYILVTDLFVEAKNPKHKDLADKWLASLGSAASQLAFNKQKGSIPARTDVDISSLGPWQHQEAKDYAHDQLLLSIGFGEAMTPQFDGSFSDAVIQFIKTHDVNGLVNELQSAMS